jgi:sigma factor, sigma 70 type, group 4 (ECF)
VDTEKHHRLTEVFLTACRAGDLESLKNLLAEDVTVFSDGGGRATVALRPVVGADKVARFFLGLASKMTGTTSFEPANLNSTPAWIARVDGRIDHVGWPMVAGDGISAFYIVRNPEKLTSLGRPQE